MYLGRSKIISSFEANSFHISSWEDTERSNICAFRDLGTPGLARNREETGKQANRVRFVKQRRQSFSWENRKRQNQRHVNCKQNQAGSKTVNKELPWSRSIQQDVAFANKILSSVCNYIWSPHKVICQEIAWAIQNQMHNQWFLITQIIASFTNIPLWTKILPGDRNTIVIRAPMIEFIDWQWGCPPKDLPQTFVSKTLCMQKSHHQLSKKSSSLGDTPRYRPNVPWARFLQEKGGGGEGGTWTSKIIVMMMMVVLKAIMIKYTSYLPQQ